jgi:hypothetical protein
MDKPWLIENNRERTRLKKLVNEITDEELQLVIYKERWTIAVMLGHLAFWDNYAAALLKRWKKDGVKPSLHEWNEINDAILKLALQLPPRAAVELVVAAASAADHEVEQSTPEFMKEVVALNEPYRLNRSLHRKTHLDEIETFLKAQPK